LGNQPQGSSTTYPLELKELKLELGFFDFPVINSKRGSYSW
jgi:hypothetical protein